MIDVGQGDAILVQFPVGPRAARRRRRHAGAFDIGGRVVTPGGLGARRARRLDWLVDHPRRPRSHRRRDDGRRRSRAARDLGRRAGAPRHADLAALRRRRTRAVARSGAACRRATRSTSAAWRSRVVHPPPPDWERQRVRNDDSLVLRAALRRRRAAAHRRRRGRSSSVTRARPERAIGAAAHLKVGHHGSRTSTSAAVRRRAIAPQIALISAGRGNLFGHPAPDVLGAASRRRARSASAPIATARSSSRPTGAACEVRTMSGRDVGRWRVPRPLP